MLYVYISTEKGVSFTDFFFYLEVGDIFVLAECFRILFLNLR